MAKRPSKLEKFRTDLAALDQTIPQDLHLPSLRENRLEGFAALFVMVVPLLDSEGKSVFTDVLLDELFLTLDNRFGGCLVPSARSHPPYWGLWSCALLVGLGCQKDRKRSSPIRDLSAVPFPFLFPAVPCKHELRRAEA